MQGAKLFLSLTNIKLLLSNTKLLLLDTQLSDEQRLLAALQLLPADSLSSAVKACRLRPSPAPLIPTEAKAAPQVAEGMDPATSLTSIQLPVFVGPLEDGTFQVVGLQVIET